MRRLSLIVVVVGVAVVGVAFFNLTLVSRFLRLARSLGGDPMRSLLGEEGSEDDESEGGDRGGEAPPSKEPSPASPFFHNVRGYEPPPPPRPLSVKGQLGTDVPRCSLVKFHGTSVCAPSFIIVGQRKCGTTAVYKSLASHPHIFSASVKEVNYFGEGYRATNGILDDYLEFFPYIVSNVTTGEASPNYFSFDYTVPEQIATALPHAKIIVLLRDPVERLWSDYKFGVRNGWLKLPLLQMLDIEERHRQDCLDVAAPDYVSQRQCMLKGAVPPLLDMGVYGMHLKWWYSWLPKENILVVKAEDFYTNPRATLNTITDALALPQHTWADLKEESFRANSDPKMRAMDPQLRSQLERYYARANAELGELLGEHFHYKYK